MPNRLITFAKDKLGTDRFQWEKKSSQYGLGMSHEAWLYSQFRNTEKL